MIEQSTLVVATRGPGPYQITETIESRVKQAGVRRGLASVFCAHTSCSLVLMENASPAAWRDLQRYLDRLAPPGDFEHDEEGPDDMPSHIKMALTRSSETIPIVDGTLQLGTWQGLYLWEHRRAPHRRELFVTIFGE